MRRLSQLHPFLFASYGSLALLAANLGQVGAGAVARSLLLALGLCALLLIALRALLDDPDRAALIASGLVLLLSSYGHVINMLGSIFPDAPMPLLVGALWAASFGLWCYFVLRRLTAAFPLGRYFLAFGLLLNVFPLLSWASFSRDRASASAWVDGYRQRAAERQGLDGLDRAQSPAPPERARPDIYLIVLDAYARGDVLRQIYAYDNEPFLSALRQRGFFIAEASNSNYTVTELSLASTLNMIHLTDMPAGLQRQGVTPTEAALRSASSRLIARNRLVEYLRAEGYSIVAFDGGYAGVYLEEPDLFLQSPAIEEENFWRVGFEVMLLDTTFGRVLTRWLGDLYSPLQGVFDAHRERVLYTLETLPEAAARPGPKFVYAHVVSPHVPYVFGREGERISAEDPYTLLNARPGAEDNIEKYRDQLHYLNQLVLAAVDGILTHSENPPVIIIMSDHGGKVYASAEPPPSVWLQLQFPILNAYHLPDAEADWLHPGITPVNSFRGVLNSYFDLGLPRAADASYRLQDSGDGLQMREVCPPPAACP